LVRRFYMFRVRFVSCLFLPKKLLPDQFWNLYLLKELILRQIYVLGSLSTFRSKQMQMFIWVQSDQFWNVYLFIRVGVVHSSAFTFDLHYD
jgi:hypothetical protein